jgi:hypothetical protein
MATDITVITDTLNRAGNVGPKQFQGLFTVIPFTATIEDDTLPAQTASAASITVTGAEVGDFVMVAAAADQASGILVGQVIAANTVEITFFNVEGTDANVSLATPVNMNGVVLKPKWDA